MAFRRAITPTEDRCQTGEILSTGTPIETVDKMKVELAMRCRYCTSISNLFLFKFIHGFTIFYKGVVDTHTVIQ